MRKLALLILVMLIVTPLRAESLESFADRVRKGLVAENLARVVNDANLVPFATKTFNITAKQFQFDVTPSPFVVNVGDTVTLNISVPSNDGSTSGHGFLLERYAESGFSIARGKTQSITFVANQPGPFIYFCTVSTCGEGHTNMNGTFTVNAVQAAAPTITSLNPSTGTTTGGNVVTITGTNFANGATVKFDTSDALGVNVTNSTTITCMAPAHAAGTVNVTVTNPDAQSATSQYVYANPTISITAVSPNTGTTAGGTAVTISGANFQSGATVKFGASNATNVTVVNATTITATTPIGPASEQLAVDVTVTNPDTKSATQTHAFTYSVPAVTIDAISPNSVITTGGQQITITGAGFTTALNSTVMIGGVAATAFNVLSPVTLSVVVPPHAAGNVDVVVTMGDKTSTKTNGLTYIVLTAPVHRRSVHH